MLKNKKVKITNQEQSKAIQEKAFELGWGWSNHKNVRDISEGYLHFTENNFIFYVYNQTDIGEEVTPEWILGLKDLRTIYNDVDILSVKDNVTKPSHYNRGNIEVIDFIQDQQLNFNLGNVIKYVTRAGFKEPDKKVEDLKKAKYYLEYELKQLENEKL